MKIYTHANAFAKGDFCENQYKKCPGLVAVVVWALKTHGFSDVLKSI